MNNEINRGQKNYMYICEIKERQPSIPSKMIVKGLVVNEERIYGDAGTKHGEGYVGSEI